VDTDIKLNNYLKISGIVNNMFRPQKKNKTIQYTSLACQLFHRIENWTINTRDARRITAAEMKYMRKRAR